MAYFQVYQTKYKGEFSSMALTYGTNITYEVSILKKYYNGTIKPLMFASEPVVHTYLQDEATPSIKGSELELTLINYDGQLKLKDFYSEDDDEYQIIFKQKNGKTIFRGFLVQDDCQEIETDIAHEISLIFTDQLGLLKDIPFDLGCKLAQASNNGFIKYTGTVDLPTQNEFDLYGNRIFISFGTVAVGNSIVLEYNSKIIGAYKVENIELVFGGGKYLYLDEQIPIGLGDLTNCNYYILDSLDLNKATELSTILSICLANTGLRFNQNTYSTELYIELAGSYKQVFEKIKIFPSTFGDENKYDSCYTVIDKILTAFGCTLFQANGVWNIIRYNDLRYCDNYMYAFKLDAMLLAQNTPVQTRVRSIGDLTDIEYGVNSSIIRPVKSVTNSIKYEQPRQLLINENLEKTGKLISKTLVGSTYVYRYGLVSWKEIYTSPVSGYVFIQKEYDLNNNLLDSYLYMRETNINVGVISNLIYVKKGDKAKISFEYIHEKLNATNDVWTVGFMQLTDGTNTYNFVPKGYQYLAGGEGWILNTSSNTVLYKMDSKLDIEDYISITFEIDAFPISGAFYINFFRSVVPDNLSLELFTKYRNIEFEYIPYSGGQLPVIGQQHIDQTYQLIKNVEKNDIYIDTILCPALKGSIFTSINPLNGQIEYAETFRQSVDEFKFYKLGELITRENHYWKDKIRIKLELTGLVIDFNDPTYGFSFTNPLTIINHIGFPNKSFIFGKLELRYKSNTYNCTLYEMWDSVTDANSIENGISADPLKIYNFEYLYKEK